MTNPELKKLGAELAELEKRAGLAEKVEDAQLGPMFPDVDASPEQYFKESEYFARMRVRNLYFALEDVGARKELIRKRRECDKAAESYRQDKVTTARQDLADAQRRANSLPWTWAGCLAAVCVAVGSYFFQLYGAIGGGLMGFFLAQGMLAGQRISKAEAVRDAQQELDELLESVWGGEAAPSWFNASEAHSGERDEDFDLLSVFSPRQRDY